jgi:hypothetical protein
MRINVIALSVTAGLFWGVAIFIVASAHSIWPSYGSAFLELASSIYSGYDPDPDIGSIIIGTLYGLVDGAIAQLRKTRGEGSHGGFRYEDRRFLFVGRMTGVG